MNKETRQFIFGFFILIICAIGLLIGMLDMRLSVTTSSFMYNFAFCILEIFGIITGAYYIFKNI